ncbi:hypothetical protein ACHWQZ_G016169 [Mnemiopsis leidyi]
MTRAASPDLHDDIVHFNLGASDPWDDDLDEYPEVIFHKVPSADIVYETAPRIPKFVGKYLLGDTLGEGSYARVKEALDTETVRRAAVKIMKKKKLKKIPSGEENMKREINLLQKLSKNSHPNIIELYDVHYKAEKEKTYLFMTFCCCSLQDMLDASEEKKFPLWQAHKYTFQTFQGLHYLHSRHIIHKDIKPANLLLDPSHTVKICDFGVAEELDPFSQTDTIKGSQGAPMFIAPEIAVGKDVFSGQKLDVWSAGVSLYNFVTGNYPFNADNVFKLYRKIGEGKYVIPDYLPDNLKNLLEGMLQYDFENRFSSHDCLTHPWITRKQNKSYDEVEIPNNIAEESTLIQYLEQLHLEDGDRKLTGHSTNPPHSSSLQTSSDDILSSDQRLSGDHMLDVADSRSRFEV